MCFNVGKRPGLMGEIVCIIRRRLTHGLSAFATSSASRPYGHQRMFLVPINLEWNRKA